MSVRLKKVSTDDGNSRTSLRRTNQHNTTMPSEETKVIHSHSLFFQKDPLTSNLRRNALFALLISAVYVQLHHNLSHVTVLNYHLQTVLHYGWIPFIIYVGYTRSNPQPSLIKCVS